MKTWSLEALVVEVLGRAAVAVQGIIDAISPPRFPTADPNAHPIPGCPDAVSCRRFGCSGECSEALEAEEGGTFGCTTCAGEGCTDCTVWCEGYEGVGCGFGCDCPDPLPESSATTASVADVRRPSAACPRDGEGPAEIGHSPGHSAGQPKRFEIVPLDDENYVAVSNDFMGTLDITLKHGRQRFRVEAYDGGYSVQTLFDETPVEAGSGRWADSEHDLAERLGQ
jgi:hypothetical protein